MSRCAGNTWTDVEESSNCSELRDADEEAKKKKTKFHGFTVKCKIPKERKSTRLDSSHLGISYAVFCLKKKKKKIKKTKKEQNKKKT